MLNSKLPELEKNTKSIILSYLIVLGIGMKQDSLYKDGKEIDGITGATLSVKSFTKGISKLSLLLPYVMAK